MSSEITELDKKLEVLEARMSAGFTNLSNQIGNLSRTVLEVNQRHAADLGAHATQDALEIRELKGNVAELQRAAVVLQTKVNVLWPIVGVQGLALGAGAAKYAGILGG